MPLILFALVLAVAFAGLGFLAPVMWTGLFVALGVAGAHLMLDGGGQPCDTDQASP